MEFLSKLFTLSRDAVPEVACFGDIVVSDGDSILFHASEFMGDYPARSILKPFQLYATGIPSSEWRSHPTESRFAACAGSVSATKTQVEQLQKWYDDPKYESLFAFLQLPPSYPLDEVNRAWLKSEAKQAEWIYHTCFSKHMAILEACQRNKWERETYHATNHPFHQKLLEMLSELLEKDVSGCSSVRDGCKLPSPVLSLDQHAKLYQRLASADSSSELGAIRELMMKNPNWVGGPKRIDSLLIENNAGKVVAKEGADGLLAIGVAPGGDYPKGLGIIMKNASGFQSTMAAIAVAPLLEKLGLEPAHKIPAGQEVEFHYTPFKAGSMRVFDASPTLSKELATWPGDQGFERHETLSLENNHYAISHIKTTVHIGTHTDAPSHFAKTGKSIDAVDVSKYLGPCQVIEVRKARGSVIEASDLANISIKTQRILFKTRSYPDSRAFNDDFVALSQGLIELLAKEGVILAGIDTPSIDPFDSKELKAHHATARAKMGILEGLVLDNVVPGVYELSAVPLKIQDGDASPVRVVLRKV